MESKVTTTTTEPSSDYSLEGEKYSKGVEVGGVVRPRMGRAGLESSTVDDSGIVDNLGGGR